MEREELEKLFNVKIGLELERFKKKMLKQEPEEIFARAFQIDCVVNIYEILLEMSQKTEKEALEILLAFPGLLAFLYSRWTKWDSSFEEELQECLEESVKEIGSAYHTISQGVSAA